MNKDKLMKSADRLAKAYRVWIEANAEYNALLAPEQKGYLYSINWTHGTRYGNTKKRKK